MMLAPPSGFVILVIHSDFGFGHSGFPTVTPLEQVVKLVEEPVVP